jgi:putative Mn2+ efflux pump MntP
MIVFNVMLLMPIVGEILALILSLDDWPGWLTYIGVLVGIVGLGMIGVAKREEERLVMQLENVAYTTLLREYEMGTKPNEVEQEQSMKV